ncbi:MAG TPA: hypothetical protein VH092_17195 [Urbifossiella sp.]|jgi:hypothetical protein|nr:hypothetical protein [Urbifossiella sp.]
MASVQPDGHFLHLSLRLTGVREFDHLRHPASVGQDGDHSEIAFLVVVTAAR